MTNETESLKALFDNKYGETSYAYGEAPNAFLVSRAGDLQPGMRVIVPGDGEGRNGVWLAERGLDVVTVDFSPLGVAKARALAATRGVSVKAEEGDLRTWAWPSDWADAVVLCFVHMASSDRRQLHRNALQALKPGGVVILEAFSPAQTRFQGPNGSGGPRDTDLLMTLDGLRTDFASAEEIMLEEAETVLDEGPGHQGRAAVIHGVWCR